MNFIWIDAIKHKVESSSFSNLACSLMGKLPPCKLCRKCIITTVLLLVGILAFLLLDIQVSDEVMRKYFYL